MKPMTRLARMVLTLALAAGAGSASADGETIDYWRAQLGSPDPRARIAAAQGLALSGSDAHVAVPDLAASLSDPDPEVRAAAADALHDMGTAASGAAVALARAMARDEDAVVRQRAARALTRLGPAAHGALPAILEGLTAPEPSARRLACHVLGDLGAAGPAVTDRLVQVMLRDPDSRVRQSARVALKELRVDLGRHVDDLVAALSDPSADVRENAADWLGEVRPRPVDAVDALLDVVESDESMRVREQAARAVRAMGTDAFGAVPRLTTMLRAGVRDQREAAAAILGSVSTGASADVDLLLMVSVRDPELSVRLASRGSLVRLARTDREVFERFVAAAAASGPTEARAASIDTLGRLAEDAAPAVPNLLIALREGSEEVREEAARALGRIGAPAFDALLPLRRAAAWDRSQHVRDAANKAIKSIRTASGRREPDDGTPAPAEAGAAPEGAGTPDGR